MMKQVEESDWKLFRSRLPGWQEAYMEKLLQEYAALLAGSGKASDKFWELDERIRNDRKGVGVVADMRRSTMNQSIMALLFDGVITLEDLDGFSEDLQGRMAFVMKSEKR